MFVDRIFANAALLSLPRSLVAAWAGGFVTLHRVRDRLVVSRCAGHSALSFNTVRYVSRHGDRAKHFVFCLALDDRESHLNV
jgi:hypothetical protein